MVDGMNPDSEEDDDWTKYADTGYTSSYDPWADMVPATELEEEEFDEEFEDFRMCLWGHSGQYLTGW